MPNADYAGRDVVVTCEGPRGAVQSARLEGALRGLGALRANADKVCDWLWALHFMNPSYATIDILEPPQAQAELAALSDALMNNRVLMPWASPEAEAKGGGFEVCWNAGRPE